MPWLENLAVFYRYLRDASNPELIELRSKLKAIEDSTTDHDVAKAARKSIMLINEELDVRNELSRRR